MVRKKASGVFDSGAGGIPVLARAAKALPHENFIYYADTAHFPYGDKDPEIVRDGVFKAMEIMVKEGVKAAIIACNTATSVAIKELRAIYDFPILGMEPAIKPAAEQAKGKRVAVVATVLTLREKKFQELLKRCEDKENIVLLPASGLADLVEKGEYNSDKGRRFLEELFLKAGTIDSIVLGCTHYLFLLPLLKELYPAAKIIDGGEGTVRTLCHILEEKNLAAQDNGGEIHVLSSDAATFLPKFDDFYAALTKII